MTAFSWLYRPSSGLILAADGKAEWVAETPEEEKSLPEAKTNLQKIFLGSFKNRDFAYGFMGLTSNKDRTFDVRIEAKSILSELAPRCSSGYEYIDGFARVMKSRFDKAKQDGRIKKYVSNPHLPHDSPELSIITRVFFAGYFRKHQPSFAFVTFNHTDPQLVTHEIEFRTPPYPDCLVGSAIVASMIFSDQDNWVKGYAKPVPPNGCFDELVALARGYIEACADPRGAEIDTLCKGIGGDIHIANITSAKGFVWVEPPVSTL